MKHLRLSVLALILLAAPAPARDATVTTTDGRQFTGQLVSEDDQRIVLKIANIDTPFDKSTLRDIKRLPTLQEQYDQKRAELSDDDLEGRFRLANWLYGNPTQKNEDRARSLELARRELTDLSAKFPDDGRVTQLRNIVESRIKLLQDQAAGVTPVKPEPDPAVKPTPRPDTRPTAKPGELPTAMLDDEQINLIRVYEADLSLKPNVTVPREVRQLILREYADREQVPKGAAAQSRFMGAPGWEVLGLMFDLRARHLYTKVRVHEDPPAIKTFRLNIHTRYVVNYCATTQCHGSAAGSELFLYRQRPNADQTVYTNFYILSSYRNARGDMIRRSEPERSLLLQYGLPTADAFTPHPGPDAAPGWRPAFRNAQEPDFQRMVQWIRNNIVMPASDYGIQYTPPTIAKPETPKPESAPAPTP